MRRSRLLRFFLFILFFCVFFLGAAPSAGRDIDAGARLTAQLIKRKRPAMSSPLTQLARRRSRAFIFFSMPSSESKRLAAREKAAQHPRNFIDSRSFLISAAFFSLSCFKRSLFFLFPPILSAFYSGAYLSSLALSLSRADGGRFADVLGKISATITHHVLPHP